MSLVDEMLQTMGLADMSGLAERIGLTPQQIESGLLALGRARAEPGDTAGLAAAKTQLPVEKMQQLLEAIGGHGGLDQLIPVLDQGGLAGLASGLFER